MTPTARLALAAVSALGLIFGPGSIVGARPARDPGPVPASVSFDFQTGIKTTFYPDGSVYEEAFDPARMRRIAQRPETDRDAR